MYMHFRVLRMTDINGGFNAGLIRRKQARDNNQCEQHRIAVAIVTFTHVRIADLCRKVLSVSIEVHVAV